MECVLIITGICLAFPIAITAYFKWRFTYWKKLNVPFITPSFPFGSLGNPFRRNKHLGFKIGQLYHKFKANGYHHIGLYTFFAPIYLPIDIDYIKNILSRDFRYFTDRDLYYNEKDDPLSAHLIALENDRSKKLRAKLTPAFSSGKMKFMFPTMIECGDRMKITMDKLREKANTVEINEILACYSIEIIGSCAFGLECHTIADSESEFRRYGKKVFEPPKCFYRYVVEVLTAGLMPNVARWLGIRQYDQEATDFFIRIVKETVQYREKHKFIRRDFMQTLIELQNSENPLTMQEIAAQAFIFFIAAFETSSVTMSLCLFEIAQNPNIQQKIRREIIDTLGDKDKGITYEAIMEMRYTNQVVEETLRKYPPILYTNRTCVQDYQSDSGTVIKKGTRVVIPIHGIHHDPEFYPEPSKFDPGRFSEENKKTRRPFTYLPFGEGPRICIGPAFSKQQIKIAVATVVKTYSLSVNEKTKVPLEFNRTGVVLSIKNGLWLNLDKIHTEETDM